MTDTRRSIFGGDLPWSPTDWTDSDDRVRGGASQSYFELNAFDPTARFHGNLDTKTLGGAGFASQRTTREDRSWDLHEYDGVELELVTEGADTFKYTLTIKDTLLPLDPATGREQSTISYEYDFAVPTSAGRVLAPAPPLSEKAAAGPATTRLQIPWSHLTATYRGREQPDARSLNTYRVARFSLMARSFFGTQEGPFALRIRAVAAYRAPRAGLDAFLDSRLAMPVVLVLGTGVLFGSIVLGIKTFAP